MRDPALYTNGYYHVFNRGVDKRQVFLDRLDYRTFYEYMYLFSDSNYENPGGRFMRRALELAAHRALQIERKPLVRILSFALVGNHYHIFLEQLMDHGISTFMHKLQKTYARKFNKRHGRSGALFEKSFKAVPVLNESHYIHLPRYQHLNILDLGMPEWRVGVISDWKRAMKMLEDNPWSSHNVYRGLEQSLPVVDLDFVSSMFQDEGDYVSYLNDWAGSRAMSEELRCALMI